MKKFAIPYKSCLSSLTAVLLSIHAPQLYAQKSNLIASNTTGYFHRDAAELAAVLTTGSSTRATTPSAPTWAAPDLIIAAAPQVSTTLPEAGGTAVVTTTIQNVGTMRAGFSVLGYYLSADAVLSSDDVLLGETITTAIAPTNSLQISSNLAIPAGTTAGTYYLLGVADYLNLVREHNDGNNVWGRKLTVASASGGPALPSQLPNNLSGQVTSARTLPEPAAGSDLSITPNPVAQAAPLRVQLGATGLQATATLTLYNSQGQLVASQVLPLLPDQPSQTEFLTAGLATGVYVLHVVSPGRHTTRRVVIE